MLPLFPNQVKWVWFCYLLKTITEVFCLLRIFLGQFFFPSTSVFFHHRTFSPLTLLWIPEIYYFFFDCSAAWTPLESAAQDWTLWEFVTLLSRHSHRLSSSSVSVRFTHTKGNKSAGVAMREMLFKGQVLKLCASHTRSDKIVDAVSSAI